MAISGETVSIFASSAGPVLASAKVTTLDSVMTAILAIVGVVVVIYGGREVLRMFDEDGSFRRKISDRIDYMKERQKWIDDKWLRDRDKWEEKNRGSW